MDSQSRHQIEDRGQFYAPVAVPCGRTDRQTDRHEIRNSANAHKKSSSRFIQISRLNTSIIGMLSVHQIHPRSSFKQSRHMYSALHGNEKLKIAFTRAYQWISAWVTKIQSISWHLVYPSLLRSSHKRILTRLSVTLRNMLYFNNLVMSVPTRSPGSSVLLSQRHLQLHPSSTTEGSHFHLQPCGDNENS
jgi:hypothetical protein